MPGKSNVETPCAECRGRYGCGTPNCPKVKATAAETENGGYNFDVYKKSAPRGRVPQSAEIYEDKPTSDIVYLYDGSLPGFYCCVFESFYANEIPAAISPENEAQPSMFQQKYITTQQEKALRVKNSIPKKISSYADELVETVFLSCMDNKETALLHFLRMGFACGEKALAMLGHKYISPILNAERHVGGEAHLLKGFVRFSDYDGVLCATITPKNFILPFIEPHFTARYSGERYLIFDKAHKAALIYENGKSRIISIESIEFPEADEKELHYRALWKNFYNTIAIEARTNPRCRMTHMPKRYWENMLEVQDLLKKA